MQKRDRIVGLRLLSLERPAKWALSWRLVTWTGNSSLHWFKLSLKGKRDSPCLSHLHKQYGLWWASAFFPWTSVLATLRVLPTKTVGTESRWTSLQTFPTCCHKLLREELQASCVIPRGDDFWKPEPGFLQALPTWLLLCWLSFVYFCCNKLQLWVSLFAESCESSEQIRPGDDFVEPNRGVAFNLRYTNRLKTTNPKFSKRVSPSFKWYCAITSTATHIEIYIMDINIRKLIFKLISLRREHYSDKWIIFIPIFTYFSIPICGRTICPICLAHCSQPVDHRPLASLEFTEVLNILCA